jgi:hypothetical protein
MKLLVDGFEIKTSRGVDQLPKEFIDFALKHRSTNGNYFWQQNHYYGYPYRLESIALLDRRWGHITRALSLRFCFSYPIRHHLASYNRPGIKDAPAKEIAEIDAKCYKCGLVGYDEYCTNLAEGEDIYEAIIKLNLDNALPVDLNYLIKRID